MICSIGLCSKNHKNLVLIDRGNAIDADLKSLKRYAKSLNVYFNRVPQCFVCKEPFTGDGPRFVATDEASIDAAARAVHEVLKGN